MNKKVSTLLTCGLMLGGSLLCSSAFAENLEGVVGNGKYYKILRSAQHNGSWADTPVGTTYPAMYLSLDDEGNLTISTEIADLKDATWTVTKGVVDDTYTLTTASGHVLTLKNGVTSQTSFYTNDYKEDSNTGNSQDNAFSISSSADLLGHLMMQLINNDGSGANPAGWGLGGNNVYSLLFNLVDVTDDNVDAGKLNEFFNNKGFNLAIDYNSDDYTLDANIFGGNSRIWAFKVTENNIANADNKAYDDSNNFIGYKISNAGANNEDLIIPAGMYFFTDRVLASGKDLASKAEDINWLESTLIMVSPTQTVETTVANRVEGQGFELVTAKGSEFIFEDNVSKYKVGDLPIANACFNVKDNQVGSYPYAISLPNFYYQEDDDDAATEELTPATNMPLGVIAFTADNVQYLTTVPGSDNYIFKFSASALKDGKELLKTTKEAAVYTIKFVAGNSEDEKLIGKYLTVAEDVTDFKWVAKGSAITNTAYPSFQYTITNVKDEDPNDDEDVYTLITFTNRETNESFSARLFPEPSYGENCYSLDLVSENGTAVDPTTNPFKVQPLKVVSNTYAVQNDGTAPSIDENVIIKLDPVAVNEYAGFYNVDNESVRTIRFARDKNNTSYLWYAGVAKENNAYKLRPTGFDGGLFVEDVYDAAQFQLIKAEEPETIARTFVYNNTTTEDVDNVANGDKVSAYRYILRYVNDGTPTDYVLNSSANALELASSTKDLNTEEGVEAAFEADNTNAPQKFYIKENGDGSISLFGANGAFANSGVAGQRVTSPEKPSIVAAKMNSTNTGIEYQATNAQSIYEATSQDSDLRTYLDADVPNLSWDGGEGHVTLRNNTALAGDYITINDDNEGILVNETSESFYLHMTDEKAIVPSYYISLGKGEGSNAESERLFLFNPVDSVAYPVNMKYDPNYQLSAYDTKAIFKAGTLDASRDTMTVPGLKGENKVIASEADNDGVWGGLDRYKFQIIETEDGDGLYNIRQADGSITRNADNRPVLGYETVYLASSSQKLYFTTEKAYALALHIEGVEAPTANESVSATEVKVIAVDGAINIKNAAGKNVVVSTILGQIVANEVLTSDNATISVPAGIAIVSVDGEEAVKVSVR